MSCSSRAGSRQCCRSSTSTWSGGASPTRSRWERCWVCGCPGRRSAPGFCSAAERGICLMSVSTTVLHVRGHGPLEIERALDAIFSGEGRPLALGREGPYPAVLARVTAPELEAAYRYLICRPHPASAWTPLLELGNRTIGLDVELSKLLDGCDIFRTFVYDDGLSGYLCVR